MSTFTFDDCNKIVFPELSDADKTASKPKVLEIKFSGTASARKINQRLYSREGQRQYIDSWTKPFKKPILLHHNVETDPIGRVTKVEFIDLADEAVKFFPTVKDFEDFRRVEANDDAKALVDMMRKFNLEDNPAWPGLSKLRFTARITDPVAIEKFQDERYMTMSVRTMTDRMICGSCNRDWSKGKICTHMPFTKDSNGKDIIFRTHAFKGKEVSVVSDPAYKDGFIESLVITDAEQEDKTENMIFNLAADTEGIISEINGEVSYSDSTEDVDPLATISNQVTELTDKLNNLDLYIKTEAAKPITEMKNSFEALAKTVDELTDATPTGKLLALHSALTTYVHSYSDQEIQNNWNKVLKVLKDNISELDTALTQKDGDYKNSLEQLTALTNENNSLKNTINDLDTKAKEDNHKDSNKTSIPEPIENPSLGGSGNGTGSKKPNTLGSFEQSIVERYKVIKDSYGNDAANEFIRRKKVLAHLPANFDIKKYVGE